MTKMKKNLLIITLFALAISTYSYSQCTVDPQYTNAGIWPDPIEGIGSGMLGYPYLQNFTTVVPSDTSLTLPPVSGTVNSMTITGVTGLPSGVTAVCIPSSCVYPGGTKGCMEFSGMPVATGTFVVNVTYVVNATMTDPITVPAADLPAQTIVYSLVIQDSTGFVGITEEVLEIVQLEILPNPSSEMTKIRYTSPTSQNVHFALYNLIGEKLLVQELDSSAGINELDLNVSEFKSGIYFVSLSTDNNTVTRKLVVGGR